MHWIYCLIIIGGKIMKKIIREYSGHALTTKTASIPAKQYDFIFEGKNFKFVKSGSIPEKEEFIDPYIPDTALKEVVELMQILQRPLLLRGEPGCGKTKLAQAVAYEWYKDEPDGYRRFYYEWHIKSTSKAQDGLYTFDHIARLRDVNMPGAIDGRYNSSENLFKYRRFGPLGKAFLASEPGKPAILLIDEIDKADIDFPNDLLLELDEMRFYIPETGEEIVPREKPLIFITSNEEREMSQAFLRRCIFQYIKFPDENQLFQIVKSNYENWNEIGKERENLIERAIRRFNDIRDEISKNPTHQKNLSTSELKDWVKVLDHYYLKHGLVGINLDRYPTPFSSVLIKNEM